ncbi:hypothetical protein [Streptomyces sp. NRRL F-5123]|uniref:hypothetical protein n=1 Tax=Streptomyces sp. NRRL F-5123 TaxID=1463856 RepID=UPI0004E107A1|nr:hypothetical protein [Streptomyces sp. NRRL F-5123]
MTRPTPVDVRAITVKDPWAAAITHGGKNIENRRRTWKWRGLLLIHTSATIDVPALADPHVAAAVRGRELQPGKAVAVARLTDCHPDDGPCSPWAQPGLHHLVLHDVRPLPEPLPCRGALGPWTPSTDLWDQVLHQLPTLTVEATP